jgi:hypothetical protein
MAGQWFSPGTPVSSINKTDHHDINEILFEVTLNTITPYLSLHKRNIINENKQTNIKRKKIYGLLLDMLFTYLTIIKFDFSNFLLKKRN